MLWDIGITISIGIIIGLLWRIDDSLDRIFKMMVERDEE